MVIWPLKGVGGVQEGEFEWPALAPLLDKLEGVHWSSAGDKELMIQSLEQTFDTDHSGAGSCCCCARICDCTAVFWRVSVIALLWDCNASKPRCGVIL